MLWQTKFVMTTETKLEVQSTNAYAAALQNVWYDKIMSDRQGRGRRDFMEWVLTTAQIYELDQGQMRFDDLLTQAHWIDHKGFGVGQRVTRDDWEDDDVGKLMQWTEQVGGAMALEPQYKAVELWNGGETLKAYDGVAFFGVHPVNPFDSDKGTYRTLVTNMDQIGGASGSPDLNETNLALGVAHTRTFKMPNGRNRNLRPDTLIVGPKREFKGRQLLHAIEIGATTNVLKDYAIELLVINEIEDFSWALQSIVGETPGQKAFIRSIRRPFGMNSYNGLTQAELSRMDALEWHVRGRMGYTYGHPYQMVKFKHTS